MEQIFEDKVKSMTAKELILTVVNGLRKEHVKVNMDYFGSYSTRTGVCFGCAATNAICEITGKVFDQSSIKFRINRANFIKVNYEFLREFENAIDCLRYGNIDAYNSYSEMIGLPEIKFNDEFELPILNNNNYIKDLHIYEKLAELQD